MPKLVQKKPPPFEFVLDELASLGAHTKPMFGCVAVYVGEKIILVLRDKESLPRDNGVWLATTAEHHESLKRDFPAMRSIEAFGPGPTGWQVLPADDIEFEEAALKACALVRAGDARIGKIPERKKPRGSKKTSAKKTIRHRKGSLRGSKPARAGARGKGRAL